ncbi:MAG: hypothetical protein H6905_11540 [Hyphomicrobiales bacterium]|nr:hypothetical protein [Hyphomicrobiales bacterium]
MRVQSFPRREGYEPNAKVLGGVLVNTPVHNSKHAQALAARFNVTTPDELTVAVPSASLERALEALAQRQEHARAVQGSPLWQLATQPVFGPTSFTAAKPQPFDVSDEQIKQLAGIARSATTFIATYVCPHPLVKNVNALGWLAYDTYRAFETWNDPKKSTLACVVDTSKVALDAFLLLDSAAAFGTTPLIGSDHKDLLSTALAIVDDRKDDKDPAISALAMSFDQRVKNEAAQGNAEVEAQWALYKLGTKIVEAALSTDPQFKDFKLLPIPHVETAKPGLQTR